jgi:hypothetical protein
MGFNLAFKGLTESKPFPRSQKIFPAIVLLFKAFKNSLISLKTASSVAAHFPQPNLISL